MTSMYLYDAVIQITIYIICVPISGRSQRNVYTDSLQYNNTVLQCNETRENNIRTSTKALEVFIYFFRVGDYPEIMVLTTADQTHKPYEY